MKLQLSLLLLLVSDASIVLAAIDDEITVEVLNPTLASSMNGEIKLMPAHLKVKYIGILGKLAFYARLYRLWISQPTTAYVGFISHLPKIRFWENILRACCRGFVYVFYWMTANRITLLDHLHFCNGREKLSALTEIDVKSPESNKEKNSIA